MSAGGQHDCDRISMQHGHSLLPHARARCGRNDLQCAGPHTKHTKTHRAGARKGPEPQNPTVSDTQQVFLTAPGYVLPWCSGLHVPTPRQAYLLVRRLLRVHDLVQCGCPSQQETLQSDRQLGWGLQGTGVAGGDRLGRTQGCLPQCEQARPQRPALCKRTQRAGGRGTTISVTVNPTCHHHP